MMHKQPRIHVGKVLRRTLFITLRTRVRGVAANNLALHVYAEAEHAPANVLTRFEKK